MVNGSLGKISRWVGENYIRYKEKNPDADELTIRKNITRQRYSDSDTNPFESSSTEDIFFTTRIDGSNDLHDVVIAIYRREVDTKYESNKKKIRLMYEVIFQELTLLGIPRNIAFYGQ